MTFDVVPLVVGLFTFVVGIVSLVVSRRKVSAETRETNARAASEEMDTTRKMSDLLDEMQTSQVALYAHNIELEKTNADQARQIKVLAERLTERDAQLQTAGNQLEMMRSLAKDAPIIDTLTRQLSAMNQIIASLQEAQMEAQKVLMEREKTLSELIQTNQKLGLKKTSQTAG